MKQTITTTIPIIYKTNSKNVMGSVRTGLILTRIQEGAHPGGLTQPQPGQTEPGIPYHGAVMLGSGGGGAARWELTCGSGVRAPVLSGRVALWVVGFVVVFSPYLYCCCYCSLSLLFC